MKWNTMIIAVLGLIVVGAAALALLQLSSPDQAAPGGAGVPASPTPSPLPARADVLEMFDVMKQKVIAAGHGYGGGSVQLIDGEETALVYIYKPAGQGDVSGLLSAGFSALYTTFGTKDPLLVGVVDMTKKISAQQFKVDIYALERAVIEEYQEGNMTVAELAKQALVVTPETESLHPGNATRVKRSIDISYSRPGNYTPPSNRTMAFTDALESGGYPKPLAIQAAPTSDGTKVVSVSVPLKANATAAEKYGEIEAILRACAGSYGDHDRYMISLMPAQEGVYDYYYVDAAALPALAFANGAIGEYQLFRAINTTYYTK